MQIVLTVYAVLWLAVAIFTFSFMICVVIVSLLAYNVKVEIVDWWQQNVEQVRLREIHKVAWLAGNNDNHVNF